MQLLWTLLIGFVIGAVARFVMPGKDSASWIMTIVLGIAGSFVGTFVGQALHLYAPGEAAGFIMSVVGALILLWLYKMITKKKSVA